MYGCWVEALLTWWPLKFIIFYSGTPLYFQCHVLHKHFTLLYSHGQTVTVCTQSLCLLFFFQFPQILDGFTVNLLSFPFCRKITGAVFQLMKVFVLIFELVISEDSANWHGTLDVF